jgi:Mn2+/Fe2+ NRAMP family transporter
LFGAVFLASAMTSIIGAAYTSVSFLTAFKPDMSERQRNIATVGFIPGSLIANILITPPPAAMLVFVGGLNGVVLPIGLSFFMYPAWRRTDLMHGYRYPRWLLILGILACILTWYMPTIP